jgi:hypothetical protein
LVGCGGKKETGREEMNKIKESGVGEVKQGE